MHTVRQGKVLMTDGQDIKTRELNNVYLMREVGDTEREVKAAIRSSLMGLVGLES